MPLGNSITEDASGWASYRCWLWKELTDSGYCVNLVGSRTGVWLSPPRGQIASACPYDEFDENHEGHYGWEANELLYGSTGTLFSYPGNLTVWLPAVTGRPDIVLVQIGTNDVDRGDGAASTRDEIGWIIDTLRAYQPSVIVLVAQLTPAASPLAAIDTLNGLLPALVASKSTVQSPVFLVDQHTGFSTTTDLRDNFHPTESGERKIAHNWAVALMPILQSVALRAFQAVAQPGPAGRGAPGRYTIRGQRIPAGPRCGAVEVSRDGLAVSITARR